MIYDGFHKIHIFTDLKIDNKSVSYYIMKPIKVYIAGDWLRPPVALATRFEEAGYLVPHKWWEDRATHKENVELLIEEIQSCDWFVFDMRTDRFDKHKFGGSHVGAGIALAFGKVIKVIMPESATAPFTAILAPYITKDEDSLL